MSNIDKIKELENEWLKEFKAELFEGIDIEDLVDFIKYNIPEYMKIWKEESEYEERKIYSYFEKKFTEINLNELEKEVKLLKNIRGKDYES